jgi:hypothetical protein
MKPFNLKEAIDGKPLITRGGKKVLKFHYFDIEEIDESIVAVIEGCKGLNVFHKNGRYFKHEEDINDLFMAGPGKWVNIYYNEHLNHVTTGAIYQTEEEAKKYNEDVPNFQCTIKLKS